ncbi:MAG: hypothetical protein J5767_12500 [Paludibacteraceae bacterium]|nr:hypothetical protein [Paludibacteraceae bacterium]
MKVHIYTKDGKVTSVRANFPKGLTDEEIKNLLESYNESHKEDGMVCHKKFRMKERECRYPFRMREVMNSWDMGGDGKMVYTFNKNSEEYKKYTRK